MIVKSAGIVDASLIRSQNVLNFGYILYLTLKDRGIEANKIENIVRRWIVLSILTGRYSSSPESWFDYDIKRFNESDDIEALVRNVEEGELSDAFWNNILVTKLNTSVTSSPYFKIFLIAQISMGDKGFLSKNIDIRSLIEQRGDVHHIFPKAYLQKSGITSKGMYNQIANYVYMQSEINIKIKDKAPNVYFGEVKKQCEDGNLIYGGIDSMDELIDNLNQNAIPLDIFDMDVNSYQEFLHKRRLLMADKIKKYYKSLI